MLSLLHITEGGGAGAGGGGRDEENVNDGRGCSPESGEEMYFERLDRDIF